MNKKPTGCWSLSVRLPPDVVKWLKADAAEALRSANAQVNYLLRKFYEEKNSKK